MRTLLQVMILCCSILTAPMILIVPTGKIKKKEDGEIAIDRDSLIEPKVQEKVKHLPSGKRTTVVKRIEREVPYEDLLQAKRIRYCQDFCANSLILIP